VTEKLVESDINVLQAEDDADTLIQQFKKQNLVIGEDIDLIIHLLTLTLNNFQINFKKPGQGSTETRHT